MQTHPLSQNLPLHKTRPPYRVVHTHFKVEGADSGQTSGPQLWFSITSAHPQSLKNALR